MRRISEEVTGLLKMWTHNETGRAAVPGIVTVES